MINLPNSCNKAAMLVPLSESSNVIESGIGDDEQKMIDVKLKEIKEEVSQTHVEEQLDRGVSKKKDGDEGKRRRSEFSIVVPSQIKESSLKNSISMPIIHAGSQNCDNGTNRGLVEEKKPTTAGASSSSTISTKKELIPKEREETDLSNPHNLLLHYLRDDGYEARTQKSSTLTDFFLEIQDVHIEGYNAEIVKAIRDRNISLMRSLHEKGQSLQCCNRFGESLLHMACRRGYTDVVRFLIKEADVTLRVKDDFGRTPLHDTLWSPTPNFDLMALIMEHDPDLLLIEDIRGHPPFAYARKSHWKEWNDFLTTNRHFLKLKSLP